ncbi:hypothetical protein ACQPW3_21200 [Actinosynnema sp. CA-248983]
MRGLAVVFLLVAVVNAVVAVADAVWWPWLLVVAATGFAVWLEAEASWSGPGAGSAGTADAVVDGGRGPRPPMSNTVAMIGL